MKRVFHWDRRSLVEKWFQSRQVLHTAQPFWVFFDLFYCLLALIEDGSVYVWKNKHLTSIELKKLEIQNVKQVALGEEWILLLTSKL